MRYTAVLFLTSALVCSGCDVEKTKLTVDVAQYERTLDAYAQADATVTEVDSVQAADGRDVHLISAFFGLDDALPERVSDRVVCDGAGGADGMPVVFSHELAHETIEPGDFKVTTESGAIGDVVCLTLDPANSPGELRTVLLAGAYGSLEDQPVRVEIVGNLLTIDQSANFKGTAIDVVPLEAGPSMVWAEVVPQDQWDLGLPATAFAWGGASGCPEGTEQIVRVAWNGGITKPGGEPAGDEERQLYQVEVLRKSGSVDGVSPFALADLNDGDNNHKLCLDTELPAQSVSFPAGHVTDPREDLNPDTSVDVHHPDED